MQKGESCLVLGKSGTGKSTLLFLLAGLLIPATGSVKLKEVEFAGLKEERINSFRARNISIIWQEMHFIPSLTVKENLEAYTLFLGLNPEKGRMEQLAHSLGIVELLDKNIRQLSRGQLQRVAVARGLLNESSFILADEPTSSLDDDHAAEVINLLLEHSKNAGIVLVSHDRRLQGSTTKEINL
jgi:putative ABC transport system ATP-binding protein